MRITKKQALKLDTLLNEIGKGDDFFTFSSDDSIKLSEYRDLANTLENSGLIKIIIDQGDDLTVTITQDGKDFSEYGGFAAKHEAAENKREKEKLDLEKTKYDLRAAKREPYLIAWGIITTLSTIVLSIMQILSKR